MDDKIKKKVKELEIAENIKILHACESGSRAWGFASPDSDYDIRFIYNRPKEWYLSVFEGRDVIEFPLDENDFDISGWDLRKALQLLYKSNPPLLEWLQSPIIYKSDSKFATEMLQLGKKYFSPKSAGYHYLSIAKGNYKDYFKGSEIKLKKYFYVLRSLFAAQFVVENEDVPPMEFRILLNLQSKQDIISEIDKLLQKKENTPEIGFGNRIPLLDKYIEQEISRLEIVLERIQFTREKNLNLLNEFFQKSLKN